MTTMRTIGQRFLLLGVLTLGAPAAGEAQSPVTPPSPEPLLVSGPPPTEPSTPAPAAQASGTSSGHTSWSWVRIATWPLWISAHAVLYAATLPVDILLLPVHAVQQAMGIQPCWYPMVHAITHTPTACDERERSTLYDIKAPAAGK